MGKPKLTLYNLINVLGASRIVFLLSQPPKLTGGGLPTGWPELSMHAHIRRRATAPPPRVASRCERVGRG